MKTSHTDTDIDARTTTAVPGSVLRMRVTPQEASRIRALIEELGAADTPPEERLTEFAVRAHDLPVRLRKLLTGFRLASDAPAAGILLSGLPVDEDALGPTPTEATAESSTEESARASTLLLLLASLLGEPFSFATQQRGKLMLDVFPVCGHEDTQLGSSSQTELEWHTEDAFHPHRADWIMLLGLRNPDRAPTMFAPVQDLELGEDVRDLLFEERYVILPDESHTVAFNQATTGTGSGDHVSAAFDRIADMSTRPQRIAVLSGDRRFPFLRIDPAFMPEELGDPDAERALSLIGSEIHRTMQEIALGSGDLLVIDNKRAVHGRRPFTARFDGTDRWLRRINISADLRACADRRHGPNSRVLV
ncbi:arginine beta-hydroxylase, Fe(II)/alpha-ketoglutarate-dependent [Actinacidiphila yanglinensis]|uniref:Arginine beta-hydroxylase, Fe(II)/alpha-ketoglutarate-dependent n=1 Tax=Actinacidiphila yanglinensis TaxID=310779 RepID=A0A1H6DGU4_9ACTN|nr:guanitoxin biosynthesis L-enduracididine beta-hydroxylase GntD [Actinacidiphila yanglinensis]SEG84469.1 arginine beta-hydroxylase, Fe(II)/alpha-ketoglutarate-dependent [Actinacidiphila yanglinensis]